MTDKAVSTEDLCTNEPPDRNSSLEAARLEAVIKTLIENKVESIKKRKSSSITSSPKSIFNKLKGTSTSTVSSKDYNHKKGKRDGKKFRNTRTEHRKRKYHSSSSQRFSKSPEKVLHFTDSSNENFPSFLQRECDETCCCRQNLSEMEIHVDDDFIALNVEDYDVEDLNAIKKAQRKKRRRKAKRHHQKHMRMAAAAVTVQVNDLKELDEDELSQRARMTIVLTACLLLFMCLLLVGITLRMAPLIDDMVRKENEELMNSLDEESTNHERLHNFTVPLT